MSCLHLVKPSASVLQFQDGDGVLLVAVNSVSAQLVTFFG